jgi:hemerythrin-like domain-containing protein
MPTREQVTAVLRSGASYEEAADRLGIPAGQAYLIATGLPADGSDVLGPEYLRRREEFLLEGGSQHLVNPPTEVPTEDEGVRKWIRTRVGADEPLRQAALARTAEPPPIQHRADKDDDVITLLGRDHNQVKYLQEQLEAIPGVTKGGTAQHQQRRVSIVDMIRLRLSQHETAEEEYFWPAVRDGLPDGNELADQALEQEQHGKDLLQALDGMPGGDEKFEELVEELISSLGRHVAFEDLVFLKVRQALPQEQLDDLGRKYAAAKENAPTRPHPHAPAGSKLAAAAAAPLDALRDAAEERPADRKGKAEDEPVPEGEQ